MRACTATGFPTRPATPATTRSTATRTVDAAQLKRKEWETEKRALKRQLENLEAEVRKRDKWLEKAKAIIKEYQKRHAPGQGPAMS